MTTCRFDECREIETEMAEVIRDFHASARAGDSVALFLLVEWGVPVDLRDARGRTALMAAAAAGNTELVRWLLGRGADPNAPDGDGETPLSLAAAYGRTETVRLLLAAGAERESRNRDGWTPLMAAMLAAEPEETVRALLAAGASPHARALDGTSAVVLAARRSSADHRRGLLRQLAGALAAEPRPRSGRGAPVGRRALYFRDGAGRQPAGRA